MLNQRRSDYSGLQLLKVITSASEGELHRLTRFWVYGNASQTDDNNFPFLFINGGAATLSGSLSAAIVKDTITQRKIQLLNHTGIRCLCYFFVPLMFTTCTATPDRHVSVMVRPVSPQGYGCAHHPFPRRHTTFQKPGTASRRRIRDLMPQSRFGPHGGLPPPRIR